MAEALWAGLHCPQLALDSAWQAIDQVNQPLAVHYGHGEQLRLFQVNALARHYGLHPGQSLNQALAMVPTLKTRPRQLGQERQLLEQLACCAYSHSHQVLLYPPHDVLLEIAGSQRLRGGIPALLETLRKQLDEQGMTVRIGMAPAPATARLFGRLGLSASNRAELQAYWQALPVEQLPLSRSQRQALAACGLSQVKHLLAIPRVERARRFGPALNDQLDALGGKAVPLPARWQPPEQFRWTLELPHSTDRTEALLFACRRALQKLEHWLYLRDQGLTQLHIAMMSENRQNGPSIQLALSRAGFDRERLLALIDLKLSATRLGAPVQTLTFQAHSTASHRPPQADLFSGHNRGDAWSALLDRLRTRLDDTELVGIGSRDDHRPDKAWHWVSPGQASMCRQPYARPSWLLPSARPCQRAELHLIDGPERIEQGWWDNEDCRRDYWVALNRQGLRLWVFEEHKPRAGWFIQGIFE